VEGTVRQIASGRSATTASTAVAATSAGAHVIQPGRATIGRCGRTAAASGTGRPRIVSMID
jgi:hypothetical protein